MIKWWTDQTIKDANKILIHRVLFLTVPPDFQYQNEKKTSCSQPGLLFQEIFNVKGLLVGWASFFHFGTENRADQLKKTTLYLIIQDCPSFLKIRLWRRKLSEKCLVLELNLWTKFWVARKKEEESKGFCNILCFWAQAFSLFWMVSMIVMLMKIGAGSVCDKLEDSQSHLVQSSVHWHLLAPDSNGSC